MERLVKSKERARKFGEVFTPKWCVEKMLDECPGIERAGATYFDPGCGEGAFVCAVLDRKLRNNGGLEACQSVYGVDIQYDNVLICRENLTKLAMQYCVDEWNAHFVFARNIIHGDFLFFPMLIRIFDWKTGEWTTIEEMEHARQ